MLSSFFPVGFDMSARWLFLFDGGYSFTGGVGWEVQGTTLFRRGRHHSKLQCSS
jgi:hypothetical protein